MNEGPEDFTCPQCKSRYKATGFLRLRCKALKPTSDSRLQDFLGTLQSLKPTPLRYLARAISFFPKSLAYT